MTCPHCQDERWICEAHPDQPSGHDGSCAGPGIPCPECNKTDPPMADEKPWFAPGHVDSLPGSVCSPRPREPVWTLRKGAKRVDAELLFQAEVGVEVQFLHEGVMAYAQRFTIRAQALEEAERQRKRLMREGWIPDVVESLG